MKQKKTMKLWQMLVLVILSVALFITMFLPAYHLNGKAVVKMYNKLTAKASKMSEDLLGMDLMGMAMDLDALQEEVDENVAEIEEEQGIKISNITPFSIMSKSADAFFGESGEQEKDALSADASENDEDDFAAAIKSSYTTQRILLWVIYILAVIVLILLVIGFCMKWSKYISLIISIVYGLFAAVVFGMFQFWVPTAKAEDWSKMLELDGLFGLGMGITDAMMGKMVSCFWGIAFLAAFIIALLLLMISVVSMFVGNAQAQSEIPPAPFEAQPEFRAEPMPNPAPTPTPNPAPTPTPEPVIMADPIPAPAPQPVNIPQQSPVTQPMGQVRCTKGVAAGQGFSLPEDRKVVVGKSSQSANMVLAHPNVSKIHCSIRYKAATNSYVVKDHSLNGTFVNGVRLQKEVAMEYPAGTVLKLADGSNEITLG